MKYGVLIPCYNEASAIAKVVDGALTYTSEVLVIDDGSTDNTKECAEGAGALVIRHLKNQGKGSAINTGFKHVKNKTDWNVIIIMDGDGQHNPKEIPSFIEANEETDAKIIVGDRMTDITPVKEMPLVRWLTNKFTSYVVSKIAGQKIPDSQCGYRSIKVEVLKDLELSTSRFDTESEMLIQSSQRGYKISSIPISVIYKGEISHIRPIKDSIRFFKLIYAAIRRTEK